jgi:hypothetical protein
MELIIQICVVIVIIILALATRYLIWYFSEDRKNVDKRIKEGDRMSDDVRNWKN